MTKKKRKSSIPLSSNSNDSIFTISTFPKVYKWIVLDFSLVQFVDETGIICLKDTITEYKDQNVQILFACVNGNSFNFRSKS
jgi:hypothetical protein